MSESYPDVNTRYLMIEGSNMNFRNFIHLQGPEEGVENQAKPDVSTSPEGPNNVNAFTE